MPHRENPHIPEGINASRDNPLIEFSFLLTAIGTIFLILIFTLSFLAQQLSPLIPFSWEQKLVNNSFDSSEPLPAEEANNSGSNAEAALQELANVLKRHIPDSQGIEFTIHLIDNPVPNAFATLGGNIMIHSGLLRIVTSENALAMVLAHEMAHISYRHPIQSLSRTAIFQILLALVSGDQGASATQQILGQAGLVTILGFNRDMEREADELSITILEAHYGHLKDADQFFQKLSDVNSQYKFINWFETHPRGEERIAYIQSKQQFDSTDSPDVKALDHRLLNYVSTKIDDTAE